MPINAEQLQWLRNIVKEFKFILKCTSRPSRYHSLKKRIKYTETIKHNGREVLTAIRVQVRYLFYFI